MDYRYLRLLITAPPQLDEHFSRWRNNNCSFFLLQPMALLCISHNTSNHSTHTQAIHLSSSHMAFQHTHTHTCRTCRCAAAEGGGRGDGGRDGRRQVTAGVARRRGRAVPGHAARDGQGQFGSGLLLHSLLLPARRIRHEPDSTPEVCVISKSHDKGNI